MSEAEDIPITGSALDRASAAALDHIEEGQVTDTEVGDEEDLDENGEVEQRSELISVDLEGAVGISVPGLYAEEGVKHY